MMKKIVNPCERCGIRLSCRKECYPRRDYIQAVHRIQRQAQQEERKKEREERERGEKS